MRFNHKTLLRTALLLALVPVASATTLYVNGVTGSDSNDCLSATTACETIGHAISLAASGDTIKVASGTYTENLTIIATVTVIGSGARETIIDGGGAGTVVKISNASAHVTLSGMTIRDGDAGGIINSGTLTVISSTITGNRAFVGAGISNGGTVTITNSTLSGNRANFFCNLQECFGFGGGIYNAGKMTINESTLSGNGAFSGCERPCSGFGGGIYNAGGTLRISNSTVSGNSVSCSAIMNLCGAVGGGIYNVGGTLWIRNSTVSGNFAKLGGGIGGTATLQNSIVANNTSPNCYGTMTSNGHNLSSDDSCNFNHAGDLKNTNPQLGPLQNNGGPTQTMALPAGSPAIDAGNPSGCFDGLGHLLKTDQRGMPRPDKEDTGGCDMGAYERQSD